MTEQESSSKFKLTKEPALPSKCIACGKDAQGNENFLDFDMSLDYYGAVLFCESCCGEVSRLIGFVSEDQVLEAIQLKDDAVAGLKIAQEKLAVLESAVFTYRIESPSINLDVATSDSRTFNDETEESGESIPTLFN